MISRVSYQDCRASQSFNVGDDPADCGVKGHAVIVHKGGNPTSDDPSEAPGVRVGCCVLA